MKIWSEGVLDNDFPLTGTVFTLITTQAAPQGTAASLLRTGAGRDPAKAAAILEAAAKATTSTQLKDACGEFLKLPTKKRNAMMAEVYVHDSEDRIADLDQRLLQESYYAAPLDHRAVFLEQLEGWWFKRVIRHLTAAKQPPVRGVELEREMERLKDGFTEDNLPIEIPLPEPAKPPDPATVAEALGTAAAAQAARAGRPGPPDEGALAALSSPSEVGSWPAA